MTIAGHLASFLSAQSDEELPPRAIDYAAMLISSTVASAALGSTLDSSKIMRALELQRGGAPEASLWFGDAPKLPIAAVARINALMSDAAASDDSDLRNIVHPGTTLAASALAVAEKVGSSGREVLSAIVLGYEAASRINTGVIPGLREKGFHGCVIAIFGGAVAAARLMKLDAVKMTHAIALSATSIGGIMRAANTSTSREYHAGLAAMLGVNAAQVAAMGYSGEPAILEVPDGFFQVYGQQPDLAKIGTRVTANLGSQWAILNEMAIKLVPGGHPYHALAEAAANAARAGDVAPEEVQAIVMSQPGVHKLSGLLKPANLIEIAHSPAYFLAAGVADREFSWQHATERKINDPIIRLLLDKIEVGVPPTENLERYMRGATVTIKTKDGRSYANTVYAPRGAAVRGIEWADVEGKYRALTPFAGMSTRNIQASAEVIRNLRDSKSVADLIALLR